MKPARSGAQGEFEGGVCGARLQAPLGVLAHEPHRLAFYLYDLASAHVEVGDTETAQKAFMEVYGINSNYRDVVSRIKQLEDARK